MIKMSKEEFLKQYCEKSKIKEEVLLKSQVVLPCNCNYGNCKGWALVSNNKISIKAHNELYRY